MRIVSLVPSWTETLLQAGVNVVGRTRFCIHPADRVQGIPVIGGTKDWDWEAIRKLNPDLLILDREENPKFMSEQMEIPVLATHVTAVDNVSGALAQMALRLDNSALAGLARRWEGLSEWPGLPRWNGEDPIPGLIEWGRQPIGPVHNIIYVIWRNPWMTVSKKTFIGSVLEKCGLGPFLRDFDTRYPKIELASFSPAETLLLFSSEPYPFLRKKSILNPILHPYAFVDGERFSWFGARALNFLEKLKG